MISHSDRPEGTGLGARQRAPVTGRGRSARSSPQGVGRLPAAPARLSEPPMVRAGPVPSAGSTPRAARHGTERGRSPAALAGGLLGSRSGVPTPWADHWRDWLRLRNRTGQPLRAWWQATVVPTYLAKGGLHDAPLSACDVLPFSSSGLSASFPGLLRVPRFFFRPEGEPPGLIRQPVHPLPGQTPGESSTPGPCEDGSHCSAGAKSRSCSSRRPGTRTNVH
jgi:hypothetical protein